MTEYWGTVGHNERFSVGPEETREMLIELLDHECLSDQHFRTGLRKDIDIVALCPDAGIILENIWDRLYEMVGELAEDWTISQPQKHHLTTMIRDKFKEWIEHYQLHPKFFEVVNIQEHTASQKEE